MDAQRVLASLGSREHGLNVWRTQIQKNAERRRIQADKNVISSDKSSLDRSNPEIRTTNPNYLPPSEPVIRASNEAIGAGVLMPPFQRSIVMARAALAADTRAAIYFNR